MPKPAKYFGLFRGERHADVPAYVDLMGVVSFSRIGRGGSTSMAYGWRVDKGIVSNSSRQTDGMFFYTREEDRTRALFAAEKIDAEMSAEIDKMEARLKELRRARRIEIERVLGANAVMPLELGD